MAVCPGCIARPGMNLYLDDDSAKAGLVVRLRKAGHKVVGPADVSLSSAPDPRHLLHAVQNGLVLVTRNYQDFEDLHQLVAAVQGRHTGILVVRLDNDPRRDMRDADIAAA